MVTSQGCRCTNRVEVVTVYHTASRIRMPIVKVPVDHKFGIVSLSRAEQLLAQKQQKAGRILRYV